MPRNAFKTVLAAFLCLLLLSALLLVAACGNYYQNPASPNGTPQATPTKGGYSFIVLIDNEMQNFLAPYIR